MAGVKGRRGTLFNERELAAKVRNLALKEVFKALQEGSGEFYEAVILRLAGTLLPRLNELTGEQGGPLIVELSETIAKKNASHTSTR